MPYGRPQKNRRRRVHRRNVAKSVRLASELAVELRPEVVRKKQEFIEAAANYDRVVKEFKTMTGIMKSRWVQDWSESGREEKDIPYDWAEYRPQWPESGSASWFISRSCRHPDIPERAHLLDSEFWVDIKYNEYPEWDEFEVGEGRDPAESGWDLNGWDNGYSQSWRATHLITKSGNRVRWCLDAEEALAAMNDLESTTPVLFRKP